MARQHVSRETPPMAASGCFFTHSLFADLPSECEPQRNARIRVVTQAIMETLPDTLAIKPRGCIRERVVTFLSQDCMMDFI